MSQLPPTPAAPSPPPSNSNRTLWILLGVIGVGGVLLLICIAVAVIAVLSLAGSRVSAVFNQTNAELDGEQFTLPTSAPVNTSGASALDRPLRIDDLEITVTGTRFDSGGDTAGADAALLAVNLTVTNLSDQPVALDDTLIWSWIQDGSQQTYDCCAFRAMEQTTLDEPLQSGTSVETTLMYEVLDASGTLYWICEGKAGNPPIVVALR